MQKHHGRLQDNSGNAKTTATITVYIANTGTPATLYDDNEIDTFNNPFDINDDNYDLNGNYFFKANNGVYDIKIVIGAVTSWTYDVSIYSLGLGIQDNATSNAMTIDSSEDISYIGTAQYNAGEGVVFNGDAIAAANTLDDYEEGIWTAAFIAGTSGTITIDDSYKTGRYTKVGRLVTVFLHARFSSISSPVGNLAVTGLPFLSASSVLNRVAGSIAASPTSAPANTPIILYMSSNVSTLSIVGFSQDWLAAAAYIEAGTEVYLALSYIVD